MATTIEIMSEIVSYTAANGRPCPAKHLTDKFGADAIPLIASLKEQGKIYGRRGRTGGLVSNEASPLPQMDFNTPQIDTGNDLAAEFAALAAKIAAESEPVAATDT